MHTSHELIPSHRMGRQMHLWRYGHFGQPVLVFPSAAGSAHEWDVQGMVDALADLIDAGRIKLYCTESNVAESWTRKEGDPAWRIQRHLAFERYVVDELVPWVRSDCRSPDGRLAVAGCSLGGYYAGLYALRHPELFAWALCMSGRYEMTSFLGGFSNEDVYLNNPLAFVPNLNGHHLERVRSHTHLVLVCGQGAWEEGCIEETRALADVCEAKGISHERDIWGHDVSHGWEWWRRQVRYHLLRAFGRRE